MAGKKNRRRKSVVDARVQWTLAGRVVLHFFVFVGVSFIAGLSVQLLWQPTESAAVHLQNYWKQSAPMLVSLLCLLPIFVRDTLTLSNRIAGPICRLRDTVNRLGAGEQVPPLTFRRKDLWGDLPDLFNRMVASLQQEEPESGDSGQATDELSSLADPTQGAAGYSISEPVEV